MKFQKYPLFLSHIKIKLLWSVAVRGAPLALGLLLLAAVCGTPLANGKPAKGRAVRQSDQAFSVTLVTLTAEPP